MIYCSSSLLTIVRIECFLVCFTILIVDSMSDSVAPTSSTVKLKSSSVIEASTRQFHQRQTRPDWGYRTHNGPDAWTSLGYNSCGGRRQSPINIVPECARRLLQLRPFTFTDYHVPITAVTVSTTPNTVQYTNITDRARGIEGSVLERRYNLNSFHFHWGSKSKFGSEHLVNGVSGPLEMHLVHLADPYATVREASADPKGIVVLAVSFEIFPTENLAYREVVSQIGDVSGQPPMNLDNAGIILSSLLPADPHLYYYYQGSLTTPSCDETVRWVLFARPVPISEAQMATFRSLMSSEQTVISDNFRPVQPLNERLVYTSFVPPSRAMMTVRTSLIKFLLLKNKRILLICK